MGNVAEARERAQRHASGSTSPRAEQPAVERGSPQAADDAEERRGALESGSSVRAPSVAELRLEHLVHELRVALPLHGLHHLAHEEAVHLLLGRPGTSPPRRPARRGSRRRRPPPRRRRSPAPGPSPRPPRRAPAGAHHLREHVLGRVLVERARPPPAVHQLGELRGRGPQRGERLLLLVQQPQELALAPVREPLRVLDRAAQASK